MFPFRPNSSYGRIFEKIVYFQGKRGSLFYVTYITNPVIRVYGIWEFDLIDFRLFICIVYILANLNIKRISINKKGPLL